VGQFNTSTSVPPILRSLTEQYTEGLFWEATSRGGKDAFLRSDRIFSRIDKYLEKISKGMIDLTDTAGAQIPEMPNSNFAVTSTSSGYSETFNEDDSLSWKVDTDKLTAIASDRE
jgi:hypothetical protein